MATKKIRKGAKVICPIWDNTQEAVINFYNPSNGEVSLRYRGQKGEYSANINDCKIV